MLPKKFICIFSIIVIFGFLANNAVKAENGAGQEYIPGQLIVKLKEGKSLTDIRELNTKYNVTSSQKIFKETTSPPEETLKQLKDKLTDLSKEHGTWYWQLDKNSREYKDYAAKIENEKTQTEEQIKAQKELLSRLEQRQKRAPARLTPPDLNNTYILNIPKQTDILIMANDYKSNPAIEYAQANHIVKAQIFPETLPNDTYVDNNQDGIWSSGAWGQPYEDCWGLKKIHADQAWASSQGEGIIVAVVDSGIYYYHEDIAANIWANAGDPINGIDDDHNGFIDDAQGWDFVSQDNDPYDGNGHGTHVAGIIAAIGNNNKGIIGVAPQAKVMAIKALDDSGNGTEVTLSQGLYYAANKGADIINASWGSSENSQTILDAINWASSHGCVIIAAAGNDNQDAANFSPANIGNVITVAASDHNDLKSDFSNWGYKIDVTAPGGDSVDASPTRIYQNILSLKSPGTDMYGGGLNIVGTKYYRARGTSMAAPFVSGLAALILKNHPTFTPEQIRQVLRISADDVQEVGWDKYSGYGRINAFNAIGINSVLDVNIQSPLENEITRGGILNIIGTAKGGNFSNRKLEYGQGQYPTQWSQIGITDYTPIENGTLGTIDLDLLDDGCLTFRLTAEDTSGQKFYSERRISFAKGLMQDFPKFIGRCLRNPTLADINNDGLKEIVAIDSISTGGDGRIHVLNLQGQELSGWPINIYTSGRSAAALGDLDKDGDLEIVVGGDKEDGSDFGIVYAFHHNGNPVAGFPLTLTTRWSAIQASPTLYDINQDNYLEIIIGDFNGTLYTISHNGTILSSYNSGMGAIRSAAAVGDINNDGYPEIAFRKDNSQAGNNVFLLDKNLNLLKQWQIEEAVDYSSPVFADLDNDGQLEILVANSWTEKIYAFNSDGSPVSGWPVTINGTILPGSGSGTHYIAAADLDLDGNLEVVANGSQYKGIFAWRNNGTPLAGWPAAQDTNNWFDGPITIADINGDNYPEVLAGNCDTKIYAYNYDASLAGGWPKITTTKMYATNSLEVTDIDNDQKLELVTALQDGFFNGAVLAWDLNYNLSRNNDWPMFLHDPYHSGLYTRQNAPPLFNPLADQAGNENSLIEFSVRVTDSNNDRLTLDALFLPAGASLTTITDQDGIIEKRFSWKPNFTQANNTPYSITFNASDGSITSSKTISITVNNILVFGTIYAESQPLEGATISVVNLFTKQALASTTTNSEGKFYLTAPLPPAPGSIPDGNYLIETAKDGYKTYSGITALRNIWALPFSVTLYQPTLGNMPQSAAINETQNYSLTITATDQNKDALSFQAIGLPAGANFVDNKNGSADFSWTPSNAQAGQYAVNFAVTDGLFTKSAGLNLEVKDLNNLPQMEAVPSQSVYEGQILQFKIKASDPDTDNVLTFSADNIPQGANLNSLTGEFSWTPDFNQKGSYNIAFKVNDGKGGEDTKSADITVINSSLYGRVLQRKTNKPVVNASVKVYKGKALSASALTDSAGNYVIAKNLPTGIYFVRVETRLTKIVFLIQNKTSKFNLYINKLPKPRIKMI